MQSATAIVRSAAFLLASAASLGGCTQRRIVVAPGAGTGAAISAQDLRVRLTSYAHDSMEGRRVGTPGNRRATDYLANELRRLGLEPAGVDGTWFQDIPGGVSQRVPASLPPGTARNVIAVLRGSDPVLRNEYVAIGAHLDHVGISPNVVDHDSLRAVNMALSRMGMPFWDRSIPGDQRSAAHSALRINLDSIRRIRAPRRDSIANGADDDGSGTVAVLEIAQALVAAPVKPKRSILFVFHNAEESGLVGARYFTDNPTVPRESIVAQLNLDMVGRGGADDIKGGGPHYLQLVGTRRLSTELGNIIEEANRRQPMAFNFDYALDAPGHPERIYCRSDHAMYARYGIPVAFFTTGLHPDYHQVTDEPQYIDYEHLERVTRLVHGVTVHLGNLDHRPVVDKPKPDPTAACVQ